MLIINIISCFHDQNAGSTKRERKWDFTLSKSLFLARIGFAAGVVMRGTYHSSGGVNDLHLFEDSGTIVRNQNFALGCLDLSMGKEPGQYMRMQAGDRMI